MTAAIHHFWPEQDEGQLRGVLAESGGGGGEGVAGWVKLKEQHQAG